MYPNLLIVDKENMCLNKDERKAWKLSGPETDFKSATAANLSLGEMAEIIAEDGNNVLSMINTLAIHTINYKHAVFKEIKLIYLSPTIYI